MSATEAIRNQVIVRGNLKEGEAWLITNMTRVDDQEFVHVSMADRRFVSYLGIRPDQGVGCHAGAFLSHLQSLRNARIAALIDSMDDDAFKGIKRRKVDMVDEMQRVVEVDVLAMEGSGIRKLTMLATHLKHQKLAVELTPENLEYLRIGAREYMPAQHDGTTKRTMTRQKVREAGCPNVFWNKQRKSWWISYTDGDGRMHRKHIAPRRTDQPDLEKEYLKEAAEEAQNK